MLLSRENIEDHSARMTAATGYTRLTKAAYRLSTADSNRYSASERRGGVRCVHGAGRTDETATTRQVDNST
ncbi:unnamed protein product [Macrosiphum euphorbiae]|uniref:Uncharacterized protein n=1 Tax=Macrosiphum euphorbiae TaxID=13131 RepID=A0AAV0VKV9_9HEMI|nr:unnamed protein product [Macrosiphum euphorbiae]